MKLRDLVANSLPRVRTKRKKTPAVSAAASSQEAAAKSSETRSEGLTYEKSASRQLAVNSKDQCRNDGLELQAISEASWRGNALYRGLEAARAVKFNSQMMSTSYTSAHHGMVTSHSAEGFSTQLMMMSRSYDSRISVPDWNGSHIVVPNCNDSCPQVSSISETSLDPLVYPQQYYHCHYHKHDHHHYHHHHLHPKPLTPMIPVTQNQQQQVHFDPSCGKTTKFSKDQNEVKAETSFFRKSFASLGGIRKCSSKSKKEQQDDKKICSVCPYPEVVTSAERKSGDKRPVKPKRKGLKTFSKLKENKETLMPREKLDQTWHSDTDSRSKDSKFARGLMTTREDLTDLSFGNFSRSNIRERSVESCSSRLFGSREGSSYAKEFDLSGFDSASLSGYESDLPRSKFHRSRSRIKTNPWLPSPQPSAGARAHQVDLNESREDLGLSVESIGKLLRSSSDEHQRNVRISPHDQPQSNIGIDRSSLQRPRSLTPSDTKVTFSVIPKVQALSRDTSPPWWSPNQISISSQGAKIRVKSQLNDLNTEAPKSRPTSTISPNTEFVLLADNLEQLANNISFEYEEMLDSTLESVSICQEDGQASIQELLTDEENGSVTKTFLKSDGDVNIANSPVHSAHSPDSGIGVLGSTDGDDALTPNAQRDDALTPTSQDRIVTPLDCFVSASSRAVMSDLETDGDSNSTNPQNTHRNALFFKSNCSLKMASISPNCFHDTTLSCKMAQPKPYNIEHTDTHDKWQNLDFDNYATFSESDADNTSYQDNYGSGTFPQTDDPTFQNKTNFGFRNNQHKIENIPNEKKSSRNDFIYRCSDVPRHISKHMVDQSVTNATLMVNERLDIQVAPSHRNMLAPGLHISPVPKKHDRTHELFTKQAYGKIYGVPATVGPKNLKFVAVRSCLQNQQIAGRLNDMEKGSGVEHPKKLWSNNYDIPRNITTTECVESPTENWQCDQQFLPYFGQEKAAFSEENNAEKKHDSPISNEFSKTSLHTHNFGAICPKGEELRVQLNETFNNRPKTPIKKSTISDAVRGRDSSNSKIGNGNGAILFQMKDASVQTDFEDDLSKWDDTETLEHMEEKVVIDRAENTRLWLLTGNMQGSADTGYSSLTRDSLIFMDEESLLVSGELNETPGAKKLVCGGALQQDNFDMRQTPEKAGLKATSNNLYERRTPSTKEISNAPQDIQDAPFEDLDSNNFYEESSVFKHQVNSCSIRDKMSNSSLSECAGFDKSSKIDVRFDACRPSPEVNKDGCFVASRSSSDSSDTTLKNSDSDDVDGNFPNPRSVNATNTHDSETGETGLCPNTKKGSVAYKSSRNPVQECSFSRSVVPSLPQDGIAINRRPTVDSHNKYPDARSIQLSQLYVGERAMCYKPNTGHCVEITPSLVPGCERADYLEFLKDAPLDRSHLKRPLFLVPGFGPVDMSCSEQINLFTDAEITHPRANISCTSVIDTPMSSSMSPAAASCGKKLKYKRGDHAVLSTNTSLANQPENAQKHSAGTTPCFDHTYKTCQGESHQPSFNNLRTHERAKCAGPSKTNCIQNSVATNLENNAQLINTGSPLNTRVPFSTSSQSTLTVVHTPAKAREEKKRKEEITKDLRERVMSLRREKDMVFEKIKEARKDDRLRQEQRQEIQGQLNAQRKDALLETLQELKHKLEEESKLLMMSEESSRNC